MDRKDTGEFCDESKNGESGSWSVEECRRMYAKFNLEVHLFNDGEASSYYTIGFLALVGGFVYRNHALAREKEDSKEKNEEGRVIGLLWWNRSIVGCFGLCYI